MGKLGRFFVILLTVCSLSVMLPQLAYAKDSRCWRLEPEWACNKRLALLDKGRELLDEGKKLIDRGVKWVDDNIVDPTTRYIRDVAAGIPLCFKDCKATDWGNDLIKLYKGGSDAQAVFSQIFEASRYAKCTQCTANNCNIANNFNPQTCLDICQRNGNVQNCQSHCDYVKTRTLQECQEALATNKCASAQVGAVVDRVTQFGSGLLDLGKSAFQFVTFQWSSAAGSFKSGVEKIQQSTSTAPSYNAILAHFLDWGDQGCWFCPVFTTVFNSVNTLATDLYVRLQDVFLALLIIITMAWLLWEVLKFMTTIHGPNIGEFATKLFKGLGTVMLIAIVLKAPASFIAGYVVEIPVSIATGLAGDIMNLSGYNEKVQVPYTYTASNGCTLNSVREENLCGTSAPDSEAFKDKMLSASTYDSMMCLLKKISLNLITGMSIGATVIQYGFFAKAAAIFPRLDIVLIGIIVLLGYFVLYVMVPFKLIDILLRMGFAVILLPLFVTCMATEKTRKYAEKGWQMFLGCWITLLCLCIFLVLALQIVAAAFG